MKRTVLEIVPGCLSDYYEWLKSAAHGDVLVYWQGDLRYDRDPAHCPEGEIRPSETVILALDTVARRILADAGPKIRAVSLTQKKISENVYEYRAVRLRSPHETAPARRTYPHGYLLPA